MKLEMITTNFDIFLQQAVDLAVMHVPRSATHIYVASESEPVVERLQHFATDLGISLSSHDDVDPTSRAEGNQGEHVLIEALLHPSDRPFSRTNETTQTLIIIRVGPAASRGRLSEAARPPRAEWRLVRATGVRPVQHFIIERGLAALKLQKRRVMAEGRNARMPYVEGMLRFSCKYVVEVYNRSL